MTLTRVDGRPIICDRRLPVERLWNTACNVAWTGWWLDPKDSKFGANAKYYEHNIEEAKKLLAELT